MPGQQQDVIERLEETPARNQKLRRADFTLTNGTPNQRSRIARFRAQAPLVLRDAAMRLVMIASDYHQTGGGGGQQTFNLSNNIIESANTNDFLLYENGTRVQPDSVDYAADSYDYTGPGSVEDLHAFYVARNPVELEIEVAAPKNQGSVSRVVYDDVSALLHERDQNDEPPRMSFDSVWERVVPPDWTIDVYQDGPIGFDWDDSDHAATDGVTATNAVLTIPVRRGQQRVPGLANAVARSVVEE